jgi:hypothetical protein
MGNRSADSPVNMVYLNRITAYKMILLVEICALLGYNTASSGNPLLMFWDNISVPSSRIS